MPGQLSFFLQPGATAPSQTVQVRNAGTGTLSWTVKGSTADGGAWLTVSPASGKAPSTVTVSVVTKNLPGQGLTAATYNGQLVFTAGNDVVTIPISVAVGPNAFSQLNAISFVMPKGGANPLPQILPVVSTGTNFTFSSAVYTGNGGNWLSISNLGGECCNTPDRHHGQRQRLHASRRELIPAKSPSSSIPSKNHADDGASDSHGRLLRIVLR